MIRFFFCSFRSRWAAFGAVSLVIAVCVGAIVAQRSLAALAESQMHDLAHNLGKNILILPPELDPVAFDRFDIGEITMPESTISDLRSAPPGKHVQQMSSELIGRVQHNGREQLIIGVHGLFDDRKNGRPSPILLGTPGATEMSLEIGDSLTLKGRVLQVARIMPSLPSGFEHAVIMDLETAQAILDKPGRITAIRAGGCWCSMDIPALAGEIERHLPGARAYSKDGVVRAQQGSIAEVSRFSRLLITVSALMTFGSVILLMTSQLRRQTREIGLLMAIGASPHAVMIGFFVLATITGLIGSGVGLVLGGPLGQAAGILSLDQAPSAASETPWELLAGMTIVSLLGAGIPAIRAASIDPTSALREL